MCRLRGMGGGFKSAYEVICFFARWYGIMRMELGDGVPQIVWID